MRWKTANKNKRKQPRKVTFGFTNFIKAIKRTKAGKNRNIKIPEKQVLIVIKF